MRTIISFLIIIAIITNSCSSKLAPTSSLNHEVTDKNGNKMLLGNCTRNALQKEPYASWFNKNYADYKIDTPTCEILKEKLSGKKFEIFMGTWCGDSKREIPRMFKILDYCGIKFSNIKLIMLNNSDSFYKQSPQHEERGMNIHRVPDLIVFENNKEEGRIIESPVVSLEKDLLAIASNEKYEPNYQAVSILINFFEKNKPISNDDELLKLSETIKAFSKSANELNTYGYVKMAAGEMDKAKIIFRLNSILYPGNANVFDSLGDYFIKAGNISSAKLNFEKALQLSPSSEETRKKLNQLQNN